MRNINSILANTGTLDNIYSHSLEIIKVQASIRTCIGKPLSDHIFLAHINPEKLVIYTDASAWAAKLRFLSSDILKIVQAYPDYKNTSSVRIKINPSLHSVFHAESHLSISTSTAQHLLSVAKDITDSELQSSLMKLAQNS